MAGDNDQAAIERQGQRSDRLFPVNMAVAEYDRTRPIIDGRIKAEGIALKIDARYVGDFCIEPVYEQYDAAEMSFSWYVTARSQGEPVIALPVFPLRMPVLAYIFVREDSPLYEVKELRGARVGVPSYRYTVNLWLRGIFRDHYELSADQVTWVTCQKEEGAGYSIPPGIKIEVADGANAEQLLYDRKVDAIFVPRVPQSYVEGRSKMRRLFRDTQREMQEYSRRTGIVPITHTVVIRESLSQQEPWICESLVRAFMDAQNLCDPACLSDPKQVSMADAIFYQEQNRAAYGPNSWAHGVAPNRKNMETFLRYAHEQGYSARRLSVDELFPRNTLAL
jgi:4,5-dihydroxyphthalate decarboxylase